MRVDQNVKDARGMVGLSGASFPDLWRRYKEAIPGRRMSRKIFELKLYQMLDNVAGVPEGGGGLHVLIS